MTVPTHPHARLARFAFGTLAVFKLFGVLFGVRLLFGTPSMPDAPIARMVANHHELVAASLIVYFGLQFALSVAIRRGLATGRRWSFGAGYAYAVFHILGALTVQWLGAVLLLNAALGVAAFLGLRRAAAVSQTSQENQPASGTRLTRGCSGLRPARRLYYSAGFCRRDEAAEPKNVRRIRP